MAESLTDLLRLRRAVALMDDVEFVLDFPESEERTEAARRLIRHALIEHAVRRITDEERNRVLELLAFAVEPTKIPLELRDLNRLTPTDTPLHKREQAE